MENNTEVDDTPMIEGKSKLINRPRMSKGKRYDSYFIYIPSNVAKDSAFPFKNENEVTVKIDQKNNRIIVEKA